MSEQQVKLAHTIREALETADPSIKILYTSAHPDCIKVTIKSYQPKLLVTYQHTATIAALMWWKKRGLFKTINAQVEIDFTDRGPGEDCIILSVWMT